MMKTKKIFYALIALLAITLLVRGYYALTDDFRVSNIVYPMEKREEWNFPTSKEELDKLKKILDQKFIYLGKGAQVYAFGSEDGRYVLKFFKFKHLKPSPAIAMLPAIGPLKGVKERNIQRKLRKLEGVFEGHVIAYNYDKENSGLLYLHLNETTGLDIRAHLVDKIGIERTVDLDPIVFVLQKRGETLRTVFSELFNTERSDLAAVKANQVLDMYLDEYSRGVWDRDHGISHNIGFIEDKPFHLDVGKLSYDAKMQSPENYADDLRHVARKMEMWVKENYPDAYQDFYQKVEIHLDKLLRGSSLPEPVSPLH